MSLNKDFAAIKAIKKIFSSKSLTVGFCNNREIAHPIFFILYIYETFNFLKNIQPKNPNKILLEKQLFFLRHHVKASKKHFGFLRAQIYFRTSSKE